eukprot:12870715-Alexandrium_andersonii.AAC.1
MCIRDSQSVYTVNRGAPAVRFATTDASPWGVGGVMENASGPVAYWCDRLHPGDLPRVRATVWVP